MAIFNYPIFITGTTNKKAARKILGNKPYYVVVLSELG